MLISKSGHWGYVFGVARDQYSCESDIAKAKVIKAVDQNEGKNYKERMRTEKQNKRAVSKEIRSDQIVLGFNFPL